MGLFVRKLFNTKIFTRNILHAKYSAHKIFAIYSSFYFLTLTFWEECGRGWTTLTVSLVTYVDLCDCPYPSPSLDPSIASSLCLSPSFSRTVTTTWNGNDVYSRDTPDVGNGNGTLTSLACGMETLTSYCSCSMGIWNGTSSCSDHGTWNDTASYHATY